MGSSTKNDSTWSVVKFVGDDTEESVSVVPTCWIHDQDECYWPPFTSLKVSQAIRARTLNTCWPSHKVSLFRNATYDNYEVARAKAKKAEDTSDLNTEDDGYNHKKRKRKVPNIFSSEEELTSDDEVYVKPPPKLKTAENAGMSALKTTPRSVSRSGSGLDLLPTPTETVMVGKSVDAHQSLDVLLQQPASISGLNCQTPHKSSAHYGTADLVKDCSCCPHVVKYLKEILRQQHLIRTRINDLHDQVNNTQLVIDDSGESIFRIFSFPLSTNEQLTEFNAFLNSEQDFSKAVTELSKVGGNNTYEFVKRVLSMLITNEIASFYSWLGRRQKNDFSQLQCAKLIIAAAEKAKISPDRKKIEESISMWLRRAKDRMNNKNK